MKRGLLIVLCMAMAVCVAACSSGSGTADDPVVGKWENVIMTQETKDTYGISEEVMEFKSDGTMDQIWDGNVMSTGTYEVNNDEVTLYDDQGNEAFTVTLDGNEMKNGEETVFKKQ